MEKFFFDALKVKGLQCWTAWQPKKEGIRLITNTANAYIENFKGNFELNYEKIDQPDSKDGPSLWKMISKQTETEDVSIKQNTLIYDPSSMRLPSMVILKERYIRNGILRVEFIPSTDNGIISIIFKYKSRNTDTGRITSFYTLDIINNGDGSKENQFLLRRIHNGLSKELKSLSNVSEVKNAPTGFSLGYRTSVPHLIQIEISNFTFKVSLSINSNPFIHLFEAADDTIDYGRIGFGTYHVKAQFTLIEIQPIPLHITESTSNYYLANTKDDDILLNPYSTGDGEDQNGGGNGDAYNNDSNLNGNKKQYQNNNDKPWKNCVIRKSTEERNQYCLDTFKNNYQIGKCKVNFLFKC